MQRTDFDFEVLVRDDASTDGSYEILRRYQEKFPDQLCIIREEKNQYKEGGRAGPILHQKAQGKYIAVCEGDDYWIDDEKLQVQADYLQMHTDVSLVFTDRKLLGNNGFGLTSWPRNRYYTSDVLTGFVAFTQTIMYRNIPGFREFLLVHNGNFFGDKLTSYYMSLFGSLDRIPRVTAVYRQEGNGVWSALADVDRKKKVIDIYARLTERFSADGKICRLEERYRLQSLVSAAESLPEKLELLRWIKSRLKLSVLGFILLLIGGICGKLAPRRRIRKLIHKFR